jgi:hypothetical protein
MITNTTETLDEVMKGFERVERIKEVILLGVDGGIRIIILNDDDYNMLQEKNRMLKSKLKELRSRRGIN